MVKKLYFCCVIVFLLFSGCRTSPPEDAGREAALQLFQLLRDTSGKGILFGHQDDLAYGIGWKYVEGASDTRLSAGDYPALFGWELGGIELGRPHNLDSVPFDRMRGFAIWVHEQGGINTFSWHPFSATDTTKSSWTSDERVVRNILPGGSHHAPIREHLDRVAAFFGSLVTAEGEPVPFIFRPWHEMDGGWFWWGVKTTDPEELKQLFRFTVEYLRNEKGITHMLLAYSPDRNFTTEAEYLTWYPGDDVVDIIGVDNYWDFKLPDAVSRVAAKLEIAVNYAAKTGKVAAFTETGSDRMEDSAWYTQKLYAALNANETTRKISYVMVWRNHDLTHFYIPHPEHPGAADFREFTQKPEIWLLEDWKKFRK